MATRTQLLGRGLLIFAAAGVLAAAVVFSRPGPVGEQPSPAAADIPAVLEAARVYSQSRELAKAEAVLRSAVGTDPRDPRIRGALAEVLLQKGDHAGALEQYAWLVEFGSESASVAFTAGSLAAAQGDAARAADYHKRAAALDPGNADYPVHLARAQIELGQIEDAKVNLTRAAVLDEGRGVVWGMLAELALRENRLGMASQHVEKARRLEPEVVAWRVLEARILKRQGEPERALLLLKGLAGQDRWQGPVLGTMAECLGMLGQSADALAIYEVAIERRPELPEFRLEAALWAERLGRPERALELATQARMMGEVRAEAVLQRLRTRP